MIMDAETELYEKLRDAYLEDPLNKSRKYVPRDVIESNITDEIVRNAIKQAPGDCMIPLWDCSSGRTGDIGNLKRVFAILVQIDQVDSVKNLLKEGLTDHDLPLQSEQSGKEGFAIGEGEEKVQNIHSSRGKYLSGQPVDHARSCLQHHGRAFGPRPPSSTTLR